MRAHRSCPPDRACTAAELVIGHQVLHQKILNNVRSLPGQRVKRGPDGPREPLPRDSCARTSQPDGGANAGVVDVGSARPPTPRAPRRIGQVEDLSAIAGDHTLGASRAAGQCTMPEFSGLLEAGAADLVHSNGGRSRTHAAAGLSEGLRRAISPDCVRDARQVKSFSPADHRPTVRNRATLDLSASESACAAPTAMSLVK